MKATGIVRRIDDLGRVVIPKEIRRVLRLPEGEPLEIYTSDNGEIILKKFSPMGEFKNIAAGFSDTLSKSCGVPIIITDKEKIVAASGISKKDYVEKNITNELSSIINKRVEYIGKDEIILCTEFSDKKVLYLYPLIISGDIYGSIVALNDRNNVQNLDLNVKNLTLYTANLMTKLIEEK